MTVELIASKKSRDHNPRLRGTDSLPCSTPFVPLRLRNSRGRTLAVQSAPASHEDPFLTVVKAVGDTGRNEAPEHIQILPFRNHRAWLWEHTLNS